MLDHEWATIISRTNNSPNQAQSKKVVSENKSWKCRRIRNYRKSWYWVSEYFSSICNPFESIMNFSFKLIFIKKSRPDISGKKLTKNLLWFFFSLYKIDHWKLIYFNKMAFIIFRIGQNAFSSRKVKIILNISFVRRKESTITPTG